MAAKAYVSRLKLVFLGSDPIAQPLLEWLAGEGSGVASVLFGEVVRFEFVAA